MTGDGLFITFEGIDGAGKSTHIERLSAAFRSRGANVVLTREPGGTPLAEKLRGLVLSDAMDPLTEALLMFAGRRDHLLQVIEPALAKGDVVLYDRFTDATFAYQGFGREFDVAALQALESLVQRVPVLRPPKIRQPDVTLWFDLDPGVAASRLAGVRVPDRFEAQPQDFFDRVSKGYASRMQQYPARFERINAEQPLENVWHDVHRALRRRGFLS